MLLNNKNFQYYVQAAQMGINECVMSKIRAKDPPGA